MAIDPPWYVQSWKKSYVSLHVIINDASSEQKTGPPMYACCIINKMGLCSWLKYYDT